MQFKSQKKKIKAKQNKSQQLMGLLTSPVLPQPLKPTERNGPGLEYKVSWRQRGVETDWNEELVKKHSLTLRNTPTFVPYEIKVQAVNNLGTGPEPNVTTGYSGEDSK